MRSRLQHYRWPGNVREGAFTFGRSPMIRLRDLPRGVAESHDGNGSGPPDLSLQAPAVPVGSFAEAEKDLIARALESTGGNKVAASALLRISRKKLYSKIAKYRLQ